MSSNSGISWKFSQKLTAINNRIKNIPKYSMLMIDAKLKKDADGIVKEFQNGIKKNSLGLEPLTDRTIKHKRKMGMPKPDNPLYGMGDIKKDRSYMNMMRISKLKDGYRIRPSNKRHWKAKLTLKQLFEIHEFGATIKNRGGGLTKIKPRFAFKIAYNNWMKKRKEADLTKQVQSAITKYINIGDIHLINKIQDKYLEGLDQYAKGD